MGHNNNSEICIQSISLTSYHNNNVCICRPLRMIEFSRTDSFTNAIARSLRCHGHRRFKDNTQPNRTRSHIINSQRGAHSIYNRRQFLRDVERNDKDASKPVARHFNLPNHSKQHVAVCGLSLHLGNSESRKTLEQKFIFQIGTLNPHGINERFSFN